MVQQMSSFHLKKLFLAISLVKAAMVVLKALLGDSSKSTELKILNVTHIHLEMEKVENAN